MNTLLSGYVAWMDRISVFIGQSCSAFFFACIAISGGEVFMRYGLNRPTDWSTEVSMTLCASAWALAVGYVTERNRHISITMLELLVGPRVWHYFRLVQMLVAIGAVSALVCALWEPAMRVIARPQYSGSAFNSIQPSYLKVILLVACIHYVLQLIANLIRWFQGTEKETAGGH